MLAYLIALLIFPTAERPPDALNIVLHLVNEVEVKSIWVVSVSSILSFG